MNDLLKAPEELLPSRLNGLRVLGEALIELQRLGFCTSEGTGFTQSDVVYATPDDRPYCGYSVQDRDSALERGRIYLSHGPAVKHALSGRWLDEGLVARTIVDVLEKKGLKAGWKGSVKTRILVTLDA
jgi:hypothetical protein